MLGGIYVTFMEDISGVNAMKQSGQCVKFPQHRKERKSLGQRSAFWLLYELTWFEEEEAADAVFSSCIASDERN